MELMLMNHYLPNNSKSFLCRVGDTIYTLKTYYTTNNSLRIDIIPRIVSSITITSNDVFYSTKTGNVYYYTNAFGRTAFLTKENAMDARDMNLMYYNHNADDKIDDK